MGIGVSVRRASAGVVAAIAIGSAVATPAGAMPDPLGAVSGFASGAGSGDIGAPQEVTTRTLVEAYDAGFPIYEAIRTQDYPGPKATSRLTEYRRVHDTDALGTPTAKFIGVGAVAPDVFWVVHGRPVANPIVVDLHETWQDNVTFPLMSWDTTTLTFTGSALARLPGEGPGIGIALVVDGTGSVS